MLYMIGTLVLDTRPFSAETMSRLAGADIVVKPVAGGFQPKEFMGEGEDEISLSGRLLPSKIGGLTELETAHEMRRAGTQFPLMRGDGSRLGWFAISKISEKHTELTRDGVGFVVDHEIAMIRTAPDTGAGLQVILGLLSLFEVMN